MSTLLYLHAIPHTSKFAAIEHKANGVQVHEKGLDPVWGTLGCSQMALNSKTLQLHWA
jgi:hypothetical protein